MNVAADSRTKVSRIAWGLALPSLATATIVTLPLIYLFVRAWEVGWHEYRSLLLSAATLRLLGDTLLLVVGVVSLALALALPAAWLVARTDLPGRRTPLAAGPYRRSCRPCSGQGSNVAL